MRIDEFSFLAGMALAANIAAATYAVETYNRYSVPPPVSDTPCENTNVLFDARAGYCVSNMLAHGFNMEE